MTLKSGSLFMCGVGARGGRSLVVRAGISMVLMGIALGPFAGAGAQEVRGTTPTPAPAGQVSAPPADSQPQSLAINNMAKLDDAHKLGTGDLLSYQVLEEKKAPARLVVLESGEVQVPYIGRVQARGKSCKQLAYEIKGALEQQFFRKATVIIGLDYAGGTGTPGSPSATQEFVTVMGEVNGPGRIPIQKGQFGYTLSQAILDAGGLTRFANTKKVKITRYPDPNNRSVTKEIQVNLHDVMKKGEIDKDVELLPYDVIFIPEKWFSF